MDELLREIDELHQEVQIRWKDWSPEQVNDLVIHFKEIVRKHCNICGDQNK